MNEADKPPPASFAPLLENAFGGLALARKLPRAIAAGANPSLNGGICSL